MPTVIRKTDSSLSMGERRRDLLHAITWQVQVRSSAWSPPTDVYETEHDYVVRVARDRYDGSVRNPFNEYECGHWYARAMSSYAKVGLQPYCDFVELGEQYRYFIKHLPDAA